MKMQSKPKPKRDPARELRIPPMPFNLNRHRKLRSVRNRLPYPMMLEHQAQKLEPIL